MTLSHLNTEQLRSILRYLIITQLVCAALVVVADFTFPPPEEIIAANELIAEEDRYAFTGLQAFSFIGLFLAALIFFLWSNWQLYRLDAGGLRNSLIGFAIGLASCLIAPQVTGAWSSLQSTALNIFSSTAYGLMVALCLFKPEVFANGEKAGHGNSDLPRGHRPSVAPQSAES